MSRPLIGITADLAIPQSLGPTRQQETTFFLHQRYCSAIENAGGTPIILPMTSSARTLRQYMRQVDGLLISGGNFDIHPSYYGEEPLKELGEIKQERTEFELDLTSFPKLGSINKAPKKKRVAIPCAFTQAHGCAKSSGEKPWKLIRRTTKRSRSSARDWPSTQRRMMGSSRESRARATLLFSAFSGIPRYSREHN